MGLLCALITLSLIHPVSPLHADEALDEITVTSQRRSISPLAVTGNIATLDADDIIRGGHQHNHEVLLRTPGTWVSRGSGQESLPSIRSAVLTGAGSCGGFLILEDSIPIRPAGFCNVNQLFETASELAQQIEVIRGPGNALYGSNALHGTINVLMPDLANPGGSVEYGANNFLRFRGTTGTENSTLALIYANDGGFREDTGYRQGKVHASKRWDFDTSTFKLSLTATDLDQETAGFIVGEDTYRDPAVNRSNPNPEAFRDASSVRLQGLWRKDNLEIRPFVRYNDMTFLQHFLPGQPLEENGHRSAGVIVSRSDTLGSVSLQYGVDFEWSDVYLKQSQDGPTSGSNFLRETRPAGRHYDFDVTSLGIAPWLQSEFQIYDRLTISAGLRAEHIDYDYQNNLLSGNTRDDGTACGFGGCLYTRPDDRSDSFTNVAPKLGVRFSPGERSSIFLSAARGFRAPQMTELYRLQSGQDVADLDSERIDSLELGWRLLSDELKLELVAYHMRKKNSVLRDSEGFNVSRGRSTHRGLESSVDWELMPNVWLRTTLSYGRHEYDFDFVAARGETFVSGNDVDTAPHWLGSSEIVFLSANQTEYSVQWVMLDDYFVDAENEFSYPGHDLINFRVSSQVGEDVSLSLRLNNVLDEVYADRADFAFGNFRYFPGRGRELFVELRYGQ